MIIYPKPYSVYFRGGCRIDLFCGIFFPQKLYKKWAQFEEQPGEQQFCGVILGVILGL